MALMVYNTLTRKKEKFEPLHGNRVNMFVCGITPYDYTHMGHAKTYVAFDTIAKYLRYKGYNVFYLQNVTDVDDHIINRAAESGTTESELAERFFAEFLEDMKALNVDSVTYYARATEYIPEIIEQVKGLIEKGYAYEVHGNVYFEVEKFDGFGKLSGQILDQLEPGARVEVDERKKNPMDFALWKAQKPGEPAWDSPWGKGRPGWHIEDTAISMAHFGAQYDIHGGATELMFPHHEAEIAQAEALTGVKPFVKYWMHGGLLMIRGERMGKSLGNFWTLKDAFKTFHPEAVRFFLLHAHYRKPIDFTVEGLEEASASYQTLWDTVQNAKSAARIAEEKGPADEKLIDMVEATYVRFEEAMDDDFNTREAIAALFDLAHEVNSAIKKGVGWGALELALEAFDDIGDVLGLFRSTEKEAAVALEKVMEFVIDLREEARKRKDYATSDRIRSELEGMGIVVEDTQSGPRWKIQLSSREEKG